MRKVIWFLSLWLSSAAWAVNVQQPFLIQITQQGGNPCKTTATPVIFQTSSAVVSVFDVTSPGYDIWVRLDQKVQITGAPFIAGDHAVLTGLWDGTTCVATSLVRQ